MITKAPNRDGPLHQDSAEHQEPNFALGLWIIHIGQRSEEMDGSASAPFTLP
jgi:hypothetical protein